MNTKIIEIIVLMLMTAAVVSASNIDVKKTIQPSLSSIIVTSEDINESNTQRCYFVDDILDQAQIIVEDGMPVGNFKLLDNPRYNWSVAQSFSPGLVVLTRIQLLLARNTIPPTIYPLILTIRKELNGENLVKSTVTPEDVFEFPDYSWIEFDFKDIAVNAGSEYYIVCYTVNETNNGYVWGFNPNNAYFAGHTYISFDNGNTWDDNPPVDAVDMCFMTYGRNNTSPNPPTITGLSEGKVGMKYEYKFFSIDPEGDQIYYCIDWGDNTSEFNLGPYDSGCEISIMHSWVQKGTYIIKAKTKDVFGYESDWATLPVTMPCSYNSLPHFITWLLQQFPNAFSFLSKFMVY